MPETKRTLKIFLCHAHADRDSVRALYSRLTKDGVDAWLDKEKLLPGQDWEYEIRKAVRESDVVVVCLSKQFNQAGFRQKEVRLALDTAMEQPEGKIFIIPARLEECENLGSLRKWQLVDLFEDDGYSRLTMAITAVNAAKLDNVIYPYQLKESKPENRKYLSVGMIIFGTQNTVLLALIECLVFVLAILSLYIAQIWLPLTFSISQLNLSAFIINCILLAIFIVSFRLFAKNYLPSIKNFRSGILFGLGILPLLVYWLITPY